MSNLLPKDTVRSIWRQFTYRMLLVGSLVFIFVGALAGIALLPSYIAPRIQQKLLEDRTSTLQANSQELGPERADILRSQAILSRASPIASATSSATDLIEAALALRPEGVALERISAAAGKDSSVMLEGTARAREAINTYREALSKDERFTGVSVPVGSLIGAEGGKFTITLKAAF